jgi:hypothetical protein
MSQKDKPISFQNVAFCTLLNPTCCKRIGANYIFNKEPILPRRCHGVPKLMGLSIENSREPKVKIIINKGDSQ